MVLGDQFGLWQNEWGKMPDYNCLLLSALTFYFSNDAKKWGKVSEWVKFVLKTGQISKEYPK